MIAPDSAPASLIFVCEVGASVGLGHFSRSAALHRLASSRGLPSSLIIRSREFSRASLSLPPASVWCSSDVEFDADVTETLASAEGPTAVVFDTPSRRIPSRDFSVQGSEALLVLLNARCESDAAADLVFVRESSVCAALPNALVGWRYEVVREAVRDLRPPKMRPRSPIANVIATFGASDPGRLSEQLVEQVGKTGSPHPAITLVLGKAISSDRVDSLCSLAGQLNGLSVVRDPPDFVRRLANADAVITQGGQTLVESMVLGVPVLGVEWEHLSQNIKRAQQEGLIASVESADRILPALSEINSDIPALNRRTLLGWSAVDGLGGERCLDEILRRVSID